MSKDIVKQIMAAVFEMDIETIKNDASQKSISKWDSLEHLNLIVELEEKFDMSFDPEDIANMVTLESIVSTIERSKKL
jgi:acyl carrier protein